MPLSGHLRLPGDCGSGSCLAVADGVGAGCTSAPRSPTKSEHFDLLGYGAVSDTADQDQRPALGVQTVRNHGAETKTGHCFECVESTPRYSEQQFSGMLGSFNAQFMTPFYIESVIKTDGRHQIANRAAHVQPGHARRRSRGCRQRNHSRPTSGHANATH